MQAFCSHVRYEHFEVRTRFGRMRLRHDSPSTHRMHKGTPVEADPECPPRLHEQPDASVATLQLEFAPTRLESILSEPPSMGETKRIQFSLKRFPEPPLKTRKTSLTPATAPLSPATTVVHVSSPVVTSQVPTRVPSTLPRRISMLFASVLAETRA